MITCTGLWLTCFLILFLYALHKFSAAAFEWLALIAFKKSFVHFLPQGRQALAFDLCHWFFGEVNSETIPLRFLSSLLKLILVVMMLCLLIDDNMHWALINLLLLYSFCLPDFSFFRGCFLVACYYCFQSYMQFCASRTRLALTEFLFFGDLKIFDLLHLLSLFRVLFDCDCDETVLFELMITCTGLWLTCFVILFLFSAVALAWLATSALKMLQAVLCLKEMLGFDWIFVFWRPQNLDFLFFVVSVPCFIRLRLWWNCAFWIDDNMHWTLIDFFCDTHFVYMTFHSSAVAF